MLYVSEPSIRFLMVMKIEPKQSVVRWYRHGTDKHTCTCTLDYLDDTYVVISQLTGSINKTEFRELLEYLFLHGYSVILAHRHGRWVARDIAKLLNVSLV